MGMGDSDQQVRHLSSVGSVGWAEHDGLHAYGTVLFVGPRREGRRQYIFSAFGGRWDGEPHCAHLSARRRREGHVEQLLRAAGHGGLPDAIRHC